VVERIVVATPKPTVVPTPTTAPLPYKWSRINSMQFLERDQITALVIHPDDPDVIYAGMYKSGIYKTIDGGISWFPIQQGLTRGWIDTLIIDPQDTDTLYAGVNLAGVYKTEDGGENWRHLDMDTAEFWSDISYVSMDPADPSHLAYTSGWANLESFDKGETWEKILTETGDLDPGIPLSVNVDPLTGNLLYRTIHPSQEKYFNLFVSIGGTWKTTIENMDDCGHGSAVFLDFDPSREAWVYSNCGGIYLSADGGENWQKNSDTNCEGCFVSTEGIYYLYSNRALQFSEDGGVTWQKVTSNGPSNPDAFVVVSSSNPDRMIIGGKSFFLSDDGGKSWEKRDNGLGAGDSSIGFGASTNAFYIGKMGGDGRDIFFDEFMQFDLATQEITPLAKKNCGSNPKSEWEQALCFANTEHLDFFVPESDPLNSVATVYFHPTLPDYIYATSGPVLYGSKDGGKRFFGCQCCAGWLSQKRSAVAMDPGDPNTVIIATHAGLFTSNDNCETLRKVMGVDTDYINSVVINPKDSKLAHPLV